MVYVTCSFREGNFLCVELFDPWSLLNAKILIMLHIAEFVFWTFQSYQKFSRSIEIHKLFIFPFGIFNSHVNSPELHRSMSSQVLSLKLKLTVHHRKNPKFLRKYLEMVDFPASYVSLPECKSLSHFVLRIFRLISFGFHVGLVDPRFPGWVL